MNEACAMEGDLFIGYACYLGAKIWLFEKMSIKSLLLLLTNNMRFKLI